MSNQENYKQQSDPYHDPVLTEESVKMYQSSFEIKQDLKSLENSMGELSGNLRYGEVGYAEHLNTTDGFEKFLQEVEGNIAKLIKIINGED